MDRCWDAKALSIISGMERSMKRLALESQGEFIAIFNAIEMQIESGQPLLPVVRHLTEALLALAEGRGVARHDTHSLPRSELHGVLRLAYRTSTQ